MPRRQLVLGLLLGLVAALVPVAAAGAQTTPPPTATYADVCADAPAATDLRRLVFGVADETQYGAIVEGCVAGGADAWDLLITAPGNAEGSRSYRLSLRTVGGVSPFELIHEDTGLPVYASSGTHRDDRSIQVLFPAELVAPVGDELQLRVVTADDALPDVGRPRVVFPSPCGGGTALRTTVLRVGPGDTAAVAARASALGVEVGTVDATLGAVELVDAAPGSVAVLARHAEVEAVEPGAPMFHAGVTPDDPLFPSQRGLAIIDAPTGWLARTASALRIAVLDDGIDGHRADLAGRVVAGYDVVRRVSLPTGANSDLGGHGTSVAGIIGARGNDGTGMAGTDWGAALIPVRVFDEAGCASSTDVAAGIRAATDLGAEVINLSLGGDRGSQVLDDAIAYAASRDVVVLAAAGNAGPTGEPMHPAVHPEVIAVGATTSDDTIAPYSNQGDHLELTAPGGSSGDGILTLLERDRYGGRIGTSFAVPFVAGAAALYRAEHPTATRTQVRSALAAAVVDLGADGRDPVFGHGRLDMAALLSDAGQTSADDPCAGAPPSGFTDVDPAGTHAASIDCLVFLEVTRGLTDDRYGPEVAVTRGQMAGFLARLVRVAGGSLPTANPDAFADDDGTTHEASIDALAAVGIVEGTASGGYRPHAEVNRAQMATFLARTYAHVAGATLPDGPDAFTDDDGNPHEDNIDRVVAAGIAKGLADGSYGPTLRVRRDQMASFLVRLVQALAAD
ncbi:MAG: S8 family serine peptidase [Actinobacteria bacterium]|nr:S8 family serine peptidase [Actinomycetota bacterium]